MADFTIQPIPLKQSCSTAFWLELKQNIQIAIEIFEANTRGADASSDSSSGADVEFDPDDATVTEFLTGIDTVLDSLSATDD